MRVRIPGKRVGDQHDVIARRVERSLRLVCQSHGAELAAHLQRQCIEGESKKLLRDRVQRVRHGSVLHLYHHCLPILNCHSLIVLLAG